MAREDKGSATSSFQDAPSGKSGDQDSTSLAARRARLRGTLSKQTVPVETSAGEPANGASADHEAVPSNGASTDKNAALPSATYSQSPAPVLPIETMVKDNRSTKGKSSDAVIPDSVPFASSPIAGYSAAAAGASAASGGSPISPVPVPGAGAGPAKQFRPEAFSLDALNGPDEKSKNDSPDSAESAVPLLATAATPLPASAATAAVAAVSDEETLELLNNLDTQLGICSVNLAQMAKSVTEQLEVVRNLAEVVQNQAFAEIGLSLNSLSESMSAALEPMKAVGELVPAIDNLVTTIERGHSAKVETPKLTPDELVMSLANQLSSQTIDPWTFKCAYMAVFPSEHPADLLRKLVDLLGTQTLSGDLFRAAYDAVQAPDPPPRPVYAAQVQQPAEEVVREVVREVVTVVQDEAVLAQIEELRRFNEELRLRMDQRENEYAEMLAAKDSEVQESQHMLNARFEEFNGRYEEASELVRQRNEMLQQKETELSQKDSELSQLRSQLDEMRDQTRDMVADLQRQLTTTQRAVEEAAKAKAAVPLTKAQTNFFDATNSQAPQAPQQQQAQSLFSSESTNQPFNASPGQPLGLNNPQAPPLPLAAPQPQQQLQPQPQFQPPPQPEPMQMAPPPAPVGTTTTQAELQPVGDPVSLAANLAYNASISNQAIPRPQVAAPTTPMMGSGSYGSGVRAQVFEVIVRQALAGAPWREICAGPMQVNNISPDEVEGEVKRRQALLKK